VLSTVGTVFGGPIGGAIGALIGQSIDQGLLGSGGRGPRAGDLSVQTSSYGTQIPRAYGTMRVAGSVVWATDLAESSATTGAKGQPDTTYSYSVSFAVALASRPLTSIGRIWADGKLIRDTDGVFKVTTGFRFYEGGEDQPIDPLIGSLEGLGGTPAYRGLALAIFENLELAEFGNRIPFLTFEAVADEADPAVATILADASGGLIECTTPETIVGYAAYGRSVKAAVEPLIESFAVETFDDGTRLRSPANSAPIVVADADLGTSADFEQLSKFEREQRPASELPASVRLTYYEPARDFQISEARASAGEKSGDEERIDLAAVFDAGQAKSLALQILARRWASRDTLTLRLPPKFLSLEPGSRLELSLAPTRWLVERCTIDRYAVVAELRPSWLPAIELPGESGRLLQGSAIDMSDVQIALLEAPGIGEPAAQPTLLLAASSPTPGWKSCAVEIQAGGQATIVRTATRKTVLGSTLTVLPPGDAYLLDSSASVDVALVDPDQWLTSCDDDALVGGRNLAMLGSELIQFGDAAPIGPGRFRLTRLVRGRGGTEWASATHLLGEGFALIEPDGLRAIPLPVWLIGSTVGASAALPTIGGSASEIAFAGESCRPPAPVRLEAMIIASGDLALSWTRRSRRGWAWIDDVDAPLGENREQYRVVVQGTLGSLEITTDTPSLNITAAQFGSVGSGPATVEVRQIGDLVASRPARAMITID
jgi:hypothetical protein